jgi:hypothetical protein
VWSSAGSTTLSMLVWFNLVRVPGGFPVGWEWGVIVVVGLVAVVFPCFLGETRVGVILTSEFYQARWKLTGVPVHSILKG